MVESSPYYTPDAKFPAYDPDKAQQMFDAYADAHGGPMTISFTIPNVAIAQAIGDFLQTQLAAYDNVELELNVVEGPVYVKTLFEGGFDIAYFGMSNYDPVADFQAFFGTGGNRNFGKYSNPAVDQLISDAYAATDGDDKVAIVQEIQTTVASEGLLWVPVALLNTLVSSDEVGAAPYMTDGILQWDRVWLKQ